MIGEIGAPAVKPVPDELSDYELMRSISEMVIMQQEQHSDLEVILAQSTLQLLREIGR